MLLFILLLFGLAVLAALFLANSSVVGSHVLGEMRAQEQSLRDTLHLDELASGNGCALGLSRKHKAVAVIRQSNSYWVPFDRIATVELLREYETFSSSSGETQTSRGSQLVGAAVGAAVAGPAGLVVGGLSGKTTTHSYSSSTQHLRAIHLKMRLYSNETPFLSYALHGEEAAERITARIQNEIDSRGRTALPHSAIMAAPFEPLRSPNTAGALLETPRKGWWQSTFG